MFRVFYAILMLRTHIAKGADKEIFDRNVDDIFESILGDPHEIKRKMIERGRTYVWYEHTLPPNISAIFQSDTGFNHTYADEIFTTTTQKHTPVTPGKETDETINSSLFYYKFRLKKLEITRLLKETDSPLPNFLKDQDNPAHITRRFDKLIKESEQTNPLYRRELYFDYQLRNAENVRVYKIKTKMRDLMVHFIYATRYKLPYMQLLRKKYKGLLQYQIGYCFALLRYLRQQQKLLYSSLHHYYKLINNLMVHMKIYEKVVRLDVDIRDVCKLVKVLNYKKKLEDDSSYYNDSPEQPPPSNMGGPPGQRPPPGPRSNEKRLEANEMPESQVIVNQRAIVADTPKPTSISRRAIRADTPGMLNKRNMQPLYRGSPMSPDQKPYRSQELGIKSISPKTLPPPTLKNGRRVYAPLPDGMRL